MVAAAVLLLSLSACGGSGDDQTPSSGAPRVLSSTPLDGASEVTVDASVSATFSEAMDPASLTTSTFTLTTGPAATPVPGSIAYAASRAVFLPSATLVTGATYTATVTTGARSPAGEALTAGRSWSFTTSAVATPRLPVALGAAGGYAILAKSGISTVPASAVTGHLGVSPAAATSITGFSLTVDPSGGFSTSTQVTGQVFAADYAVPAPANLTAAIGAMELAFTDAAGRAPGVTELGAGSIGGLTLPPGVYKWSSGLLIPTDITLNGLSTDVWIFQVAQNLLLSSGVRVHLAGGALPRNVFWQVAGSVELGTTAHLEGIVLSQTAVTLRTGASIDGRLLAQTAVTLDGSTVVEPAP